MKELDADIHNNIASVAVLPAESARVVSVATEEADTELDNSVVNQTMQLLGKVDGHSWLLTMEEMPADVKSLADSEVIPGREPMTKIGIY